MIRCPACGEELVDFLGGLPPIRVCRACGGSLLPLRKLSEFVQSRHAVAIGAIDEGTARKGRRICPTCRKWMLVANVPNRVSSYELDLCDPCDVAWFDAGELAQAPTTPEVIDRNDARLEKLDDLLRLWYGNRFGAVPFRIDRQDFNPGLYYWLMALEVLMRDDTPRPRASHRHKPRPGG